MAVHRYWRLTGFCTRDNGPLELSEARLYEGTTLADATSTLSATVAPTAGALADLRDGLATWVVSWPYATYAQPGFALLWDFGAGSGIEFATLRLGSGTRAGTYPLDILLQYSDDGTSWTTYKSVVAAIYPGALTLTAEPSVAIIDPNFPSVSLLVRDALADESAAARPVTNLGGVTVSTSQSKFGGSSLYFDGTGGLSLPAAPAMCYLGGDFTLEAWVYLVDSSKKWLQLLDARTSAATEAPWVWTIEAEEGGVYKLCLFNGTYYRAQTAIPLLQWVHVATTRVGSTLRHFLNGVEIGAMTLAGALAGTATMYVGGKDTSLYKFKGYMDGLRLTNGVPRYAGDFIPASFDNELLVLPIDTGPPSRVRFTAPKPEQMRPTVAPSKGAASSHLREYAFFDAYHGGLGIIYGTVKEKNTPANAPLRRKVRLMDERSGLVIRETWSDAATGAYEFRGIKQGTPYTVLAYDHAHNYRAFAGDNLLPDPMP